MKILIKRTCAIFLPILCLAVVIGGLFSCKEDLGYRLEYITLDEDYLLFESFSAEQTINVKSEKSGLTSAVAAGWCTATLTNGKLTVAVETNETNLERRAVVRIEGGGATKALVVMQEARKMDISGIDIPFDYLTVFTDHTCSELKAGVTESTVAAIANSFFRTLAGDILAGRYNKEFRVQDYRSWQYPDIMAAQNKTSPYSLRDNPTGIFALSGDEIVVFVGDTHSQSVSVFIQNPDAMISGTDFPIHTGMNRIVAPHSGLMYVMYHTNMGTEPTVRINFVTGSVNGYFDSQKHTPEDWKRLLSNASFRHFDLLGEYAHLTYETAKFRQLTPDGLALVEKYDELVRLEQEFMGLFKYNRAFKNRMYFLVMHSSSYMHASSYYTGYDVATQLMLLDPDQFSTTSVWGPAHEVGHANQTRPGLRWAGMTEVTNNILSLYVQTTFGNRSRLLVNDVYTTATREIIDDAIPHNKSADPFNKVVPFWQLKLYLMDAQGKTDFYKDVYEQVRLRPDPATQGQCQIEFVKIACEVAQLDLTEFFEAWGFLTPVDMVVSDYGDFPFQVTQAMVDDAKNYIAALGYAKPRHKIQDITDANVNSFK